MAGGWSELQFAEKRRPTLAEVISAVPDNPAYIQLQAQLSSTLNDQSALDGQLLKLRAQIANYQRNVATSPQIGCPDRVRFIAEACPEKPSASGVA